MSCFEYTCVFIFCISFYFFLCFQFLTDCANTLNFKIIITVGGLHVLLLGSISQHVVFVNFTKKLEWFKLKIQTEDKERTVKGGIIQAKNNGTK